MRTSFEQLGRRVLENAPVAVVVLSPDGVIEHVNPFLEKLSGHRIEDLRGKDWFDTLLPVRDRDRMRSRFRESRAGEGANGFVNPIVTRAGHERMIEWTDEHLRDEDGTPIGVLAIGQDVTERLQAEAAQCANRAQRDEVQRLAQLGSWELDLVTSTLVWSDEIYRIFEIDPAPFGASYESFLAAIHPDDRARVDGAYRRSLAEKTPYEIIHRLRMADGRIKWVQERCLTHYDERGHPMRSVGTVQDVTVRHLLELRLEHAQAFAHLGSWELDLTSGVVWWSDEVFRLLGLAPGACKPSFDAFLAVVHPDDREQIRAKFEWSRVDGKDYDVEHRLRIADDAVTHVRDQVRYVFDDEGRPRRIEGTLQDVTALVQVRLRLQNILDSMFAFVGVCDLDGLLVEANRAPLEVAGLVREQVLHKPFWETYWWSHSSATQAQLRAALARAARGEVARDDFVVRVADDRFITVDAVFSALRDTSGAIVATVGSGVDITDRKHAEAAARRNADLLRTVIDNVPVVLFAADRMGTCKLWEGRGLAKIGHHPGSLVGTSLTDRYAAIPGFADAFHRALGGEQARLLTSAVGTVLEAIYGPSYDALGEIDGMIGVAFDVGERVVAEEALREREARLSAVFHHTSDSMLLLSVDEGFHVVAANRAFVQRIAMLWPVTENDLLGLTFEELTLDVYKRPREVLATYTEALDRVRATKTPVTFEHSMRFPASYVYAEVTLVPIPDADGACAQILWSSRDVTGRRLAEQQTAASLREKETLLREIHHRVKNNLQLVGSLLHFQSKKLRTPDDLAAFEELRQRIYAMTLVHERLYQATDVAHLDIGIYIHDLVAEIRRTFEPRDDVRIEVESDDVRLSIEQALPCGMIISELVTNIWKYAFPKGTEGVARITVHALGRRVVLGVDDNGVGFPEAFDAQAGNSFGWELVRMLALQLDATIVVLREERGAHVRISFELAR